LKLLSNLSFEKLAKSIIKPRPDRTVPPTVNTAGFESTDELFKVDIEPKVATAAPNIETSIYIGINNFIL
tara:strand:- start:484 stop:693 length:210 start_codon:yes stop_codon:yes gene_type:complete